MCFCIEIEKIPLNPPFQRGTFKAISQSNEIESAILISALPLDVGIHSMAVVWSPQKLLSSSNIPNTVSSQKTHF
jgi:hypothetical protein